MDKVYELSIEDMGTVEKLNYGNYMDIAEHLMKTDPQLAMLLSDALSARITLEAMVTNPKGYLKSKEGE